MNSKGFFITFEGIDGSGKSTQAKLLADDLGHQGHNVLLTREPGGSTGAEQIRALVLEGDLDRWSPETELLLFTAARRDHMETVILPALNNEKIVICDRFADSTRMYQGLSRGDLRGMVDTLTALMIQRLQEKMRAGFLKLAEEFSERIHVINGSQDINSVHNIIWDLVQDSLK